MSQLFSMKPPVLASDIDNTIQGAIGAINAFQGLSRDFLTMLDNLPVGIMLKGKDYRYAYCNEAYARYLVMEKSQIIGKRDRDIFQPDVAQKVVDADRCILERTHQRCKTIWNLGNAQNGDKWVNVRKRPILDEWGNVSYVLGLMEDIIGDNEAQIQMNLRDFELKRAIEAEQRANRAKSDFISNMSHEMRTPLNAIIGMSQIAQETSDSQKIEYCLRKISVASAALLSNINNILDMSKIEAGKLELDHIDFSLEKVIQDVCSVISVRANEKKQILRISISPDIPEHFIGDAVRLGQVFMNLLANAVKYTPNEGEITMSVVLLSSDASSSVVQARVKDTGVGFTEAEIGNAFEPYAQFESGGPWRGGGTGLGLSIAKNIVELMNGEISVSSVPGKGSEFVFQVQLQNADVTPFEIKAEAESKLHILVGDPYMKAESEYYNLLNGKNVVITFAKSCADILEMMEDGVFEETPFDVMFFDFDIFHGKCKKFLQEMKTRIGKQKVVLVVAGTQFKEIEQQISPGDVEKMLPRPLFASSVRQAVDELTSAAVVQEDERPKLCAGKRVLVAEDVIDNTEIIQAFLEKWGISVDWAQNGQEAVAMYQAAKGAYDLILMDIQMPLMDGYQATKYIRRMEVSRSAYTPIIAITANVFREDLDRCVAAGMDDYITKPLDKERAMSMIFDYLTREESGEPLDEDDYFEENDMWKESADTDPQRLPLLNFAEGLDRVDGNAVLYTRLLNGFATGSRWREFICKWKNGSQEELSDTVHMLKGLAGNLAFIRLKYMLAKLEQEIHAGRRSSHRYNLVNKCFDETIEHILANSTYLVTKRT